MTAITIQGRNCSAGMKPILACLPRILLTEMKSLSGSLSMVIGGVGSGEWEKGEGESGGRGEGENLTLTSCSSLYFFPIPHSPLSATAIANEEESYYVNGNYNGKGKGNLSHNWSPVITLLRLVVSKKRRGCY